MIASQCRHQPNTMGRVDEVFQGTKGTIHTDGSDRAILKSWHDSVIYDHEGDDDPNPYQQEHDELFASIRNGGVISDVENAAKSTLTAIMGRMATYTGQVIEWDDAMNSDEVLVPDEIDWDSTPPVQPDDDDNYPVPRPGQMG